jgi:mono/diheme cytochrome c family protein
MTAAFGPLALCALAAAPAAAFNFFNPSLSDSIPKVISGTGLFADMRTKALGADVTPFEVNAPLWTDGAIKQRFIAVPKGSQVIYDDTADTYKYPDRAMVIKNFSVDTIPGDPSSRILVETRFSGVKKVSGKDKWFLWAYRWRLDQTDADLVTDTGANALVRVYDHGAGQPPRLKKWRYPDKVQCAACHRIAGTGGRVVLAFFTAQLNRALPSGENQLQRFFDAGLLAMPAGVPRPDFAKSPRWARWDDTTAGLEVRSRSYIAANCSGCHGARGIATAAANAITIDYDYHDMKPHMDLAAKKLVGAFPVDSAGLIVPGHPERSVLLFRQKSRNTKDQDFTAEKYAMPPLGSFEPDTNAIKVITAWIAQMPAASALAGARPAPQGLRARDGRVFLPEGLSAGDGVPALLDLRGRAHPLVRDRDGAYRYGAGLHGIHLVTWNGRVLGKVVL